MSPHQPDSSYLARRFLLHSFETFTVHSDSFVPEPLVLYVVDAFSEVPFRGNPAAVCVTDRSLDESLMKNLAMEMNLAETAFAHPIEDGFSLRWLTPASEVDLCGHATLATALVLWETQQLAQNQTARFKTRSGWLECKYEAGWIEMDFPSLESKVCPVPNGFGQALGYEPSSMYQTSMDYLVELPDAATLLGLQVDMNAVARYPVRGVIATSPSDRPGVDFLSRFFAPAVGVNEDPVTGSAHCALGPYWEKKLGKSALVGYQASPRGGTVRIQTRKDRVLLRGQGVMVSRVEILTMDRSVPR